MSIQREIIEALSATCEQTAEIVAAVHYGSYAQGLSDEWSDLDIIFFVAEDSWSEFSGKIDVWISSLPHVLHTYRDGPSPRVIFDTGSYPLRLDTTFWPISKLSELSKFPFQAQKHEDVIFYAGALGPEIVMALELNKKESHDSFDAAKNFKELEGDYWYHCLRVYAFMKRGDHAMALTEYHWCVVDNVAWLLCLQSGKTKNWRSGHAINRLKLRLSETERSKLDEFLPENATSLSVAMDRNVTFTWSLIQEIARDVSVAPAEPLAKKVIALFHQV